MNDAFHLAPAPLRPFSLLQEHLARKGEGEGERAGPLYGFVWLCGYAMTMAHANIFCAHIFHLKPLNLPLAIILRLSRSYIRSLSHSRSQTSIKSNKLYPITWRPKERGREKKRGGRRTATISWKSYQNTRCMCGSVCATRRDSYIYIYILVGVRWTSPIVRYSGGRIYTIHHFGR